MEHVLVVTGGNAPSKKYIENLFTDNTYVVAVDSGLEHCKKWSLNPQLIIGDMDSLKEPKLLKQYPQAKIDIHPRDKDYSDTELALMELQAMKLPITLLGGGEGRLDHTLALLALFQRKFHPQRWITALEDIFYVERKFSFLGWKGRRLSLFPLERDCIFNSQGLKWELEQYSMNWGQFSLSNEMSGSQGEIFPQKGSALLMLSIAD
ncbi:MAG: thiamine diphosphokinase [Spirochaetaceae bacterium]|jgi:thiamine pyrophosphokinase|nr:thiamine diphosphokinase [Spirochaetaceae bacterium]